MNAPPQPHLRSGTQRSPERVTDEEDDDEITNRKDRMAAGSEAKRLFHVITVTGGTTFFQMEAMPTIKDRIDDAEKCTGDKTAPKEFLPTSCSQR